MNFLARRAPAVRHLPLSPLLVKLNARRPALRIRCIGTALVRHTRLLAPRRHRSRRSSRHVSPDLVETRIAILAVAHTQRLTAYLALHRVKGNSIRVCIPPVRRASRYRRAFVGLGQTESEAVALSVASNRDESPKDRARQPRARLHVPRSRRCRIRSRTLSAGVSVARSPLSIAAVPIAATRVSRPPTEAVPINGAHVVLVCNRRRASRIERWVVPAHRK